MGLRIEDLNRDLTKYEPILMLVTNLSRQAKLSYTNLPFVIKVLDKLLLEKTKQVCEKIRNVAKENLLQVICKCGKETDFDFINYEYLIKLLDQIEKETKWLKRII